MVKSRAADSEVMRMDAVVPADGTSRPDGGIDELIEANLPLVQAVTLQVSASFPRHVDREELSRAGMLGLVEAAQRYDPGRGVEFRRFAASRIRGAILDGLRKSDWAPRSLRASARNIETTRQRMASELGNLPSKAQLAEALDISEQALGDVEERITRSTVITLNGRMSQGDEEPVELMEMLIDRTESDPHEHAETEELHVYLRAAVSLLPERHRLVIIGYFLEDKTSEDLARFLGITESRVSQIRSEGLEMLRDGINSQYEENPSSAAPIGRVARRKAGYATAIAEAFARS